MVCCEAFSASNRCLMIGKISCLIAMLTVCAVASGKEISQLIEYQVKAAFLYSFTKLVKWPASALPESSPL